MDSHEESYWQTFFEGCGIPPFECSQYSKIFHDNRIQKDMLMELTKEYLRDMGISRTGDIIAILRRAKIAYEEYLREATLKGKIVEKELKFLKDSSSNVDQEKKEMQNKAGESLTKNTEGSNVSGDQLPNVLFDPVIVAKLSQEKQLIEKTYPYISKENDTQEKKSKSQGASVTSLISEETSSHIRQYLGSQMATRLSPRLKSQAAKIKSETISSDKQCQSTSSNTEVHEMNLQQEIETSVVDSQDVHFPSRKLKEVIVTKNEEGETIELEVHLNPDHSGEEAVVLVSGGGVGDSTDLGGEEVVEEVTQEVVEQESVSSSSKKGNKVVCLFSEESIKKARERVAPGILNRNSVVKRKREFNVMTVESKEMEDLRYDIGRSLLSLKNTRVKPNGEEMPKRILGVNYKKRREKAKSKERAKLLQSSQSTRPYDDHSPMSAVGMARRFIDRGYKKIRVVRNKNLLTEQAEIEGKIQADLETTQAVDSIATKSQTVNNEVTARSKEGETSMQMDADSTNLGLDIQSSRETQYSDSDMDSEDILDLELEEDSDEVDEIQESELGRTKKFVKLPVLDMKNLTKYQYRDIIPVLLKLTTCSDKIQPTWWPHGMVWCVKKNIYDQPNISLEALYKVVKNCYTYYNQVGSLKNEPTFENLEDLDYQQFRLQETINKMDEDISLLASPEGKERITKRSSSPSSDEQTVSTSTPDAGLEPTFKCTFCEEYFTKEDLKIHVKNHSGAKPYKCDYCDKSFSGKGAQQSHMRIHTRTQPHKCDVCDGTFRDKYQLSAHLKRHSKAAFYRCVFCEQVFDEDEHLQTHLRIHAGEKPYKCELCNKTFSYSSNYKVHMRLHTGDKPYKCRFCNERFRQLHGLKTHISKHTGIKPFRCGLCEKQFLHKRSLQIHLKLHAANFEIEKMHAEDIPGRCDSCKTLFTAKMDLLRRVRINSSDLPYGCRECSKCFAQAEELKSHFRIHAKESTYGCLSCNKKGY